jgi:type IV pilus assembly protein PilW
MKTTKLQARPRASQAGVGLIELMVSVVIGLFLIFGAVTVYSKSRNVYRTTEAAARLQETARYAFDVIEPDVRMASYLGLSNRPEYIVNRAGPDEDTPADLSDADTVINLCGDNWAINLDQYIAANNGNGAADLGLADCEPFRDAWQNDSDVLIVRRGAEVQPAALAPNRLYLQTSRIQGTIFWQDPSACTNPKNPACIPASYSPPASETRELVSTAYYVSSQSTARADVPSLRRKRLVAGAVIDEEIATGVEDLQVRFGVDTDNNGTANVYVDPQANPADYGGRIVAATIWLRVRAENPEVGFNDDRSYTYADLDATGEPALAVPDDGFRRFVISKTIQLRDSPL